MVLLLVETSQLVQTPVRLDKPERTPRMSLPAKTADPDKKDTSTPVPADTQATVHSILVIDREAPILVV